MSRTRYILPFPWQQKLALHNQFFFSASLADLLHNWAAFLHNFADFQNLAYMHPIQLKLDPTSPKPCINHVQAQKQTSNQGKAKHRYPKPTKFSEFSRFERWKWKLGDFWVNSHLHQVYNIEIDLLKLILR